LEISQEGEKVTDLFSDYERVRKCIGHLFALRNPLNAKTYGLCLLAMLLQVAACSAGENAGVSSPADTNAYFPLAVGNKWEYECSVEGEHAFDKVLTITAIEMSGGNKLYRGESQTDDGDDPLVQYYSVDGKGVAYSSLEKSNKDKAPIISASPKDGEAINGLFVRKAKKIDIPGLGAVTAILVENFEFDNPKLSDSQRIEWEGKSYARGIGLVTEADGLGGECVLKKFFNATKIQ
jgi:hypothetical protein